MGSRLKTRDIQAQEALCHRLGYKNTSSLSFLTKGAPNSTTIRDTNTDLVWKVLWNKEQDNHHLERTILETLPENEHILKHVAVENLEIEGEIREVIVFPYINKQSLYELIKSKVDSRQQPFSYLDIKKMAEQMVEGIAFLNNNKVIHQDIKPANILFSDGKALLIDLGIAKFIGESTQKFKKIEGPYAYMSPEKLALVANNKFNNSSQITFASDLFSLGLVLYEMATLKNATQDMELAIGNLDDLSGILMNDSNISYQTKEIILPFFESNPYDRQNKVADIFNIKWWVQTENKEYRFWYHGGWGSDTEYSDYFNSEDFPSEGNFGYIYPAEIARSVKSTSNIIDRGVAVKEKGGVFAFDPCTYLQLLPELNHRGVKYFNYRGRMYPSQIIDTPPSLGDYVNLYVQNVFNAQIDMGADILISPYFYIERFSNKIAESNFKLWHISSKFETDLPKYYGLLLAESFLSNENDVKKLAMIISNQHYAENIYLRIESDRPDSSMIKDVVYLNNLKLLIEHLSESKRNIFMSSCGVEGLGLLSFGLTELSTHYLFSKRKFVYKNKTLDQDSAKQPDLRYFVRKLLNEVKALAELVNPAIQLDQELNNIFLCNCPHCPNRDPVSLLRHFLYNFRDMFNILVGKKTDDRRSFFKRWLSDAKNYYGLLDRNPNIQLSKSSSGEFLDAWDSVF